MSVLAEDKITYMKRFYYPHVAQMLVTNTYPMVNIYRSGHIKKRYHVFGSLPHGKKLIYMNDALFVVSGETTVDGRPYLDGVCYGKFVKGELMPEDEKKLIVQARHLIQQVNYWERN